MRTSPFGIGRIRVSHDGRHVGSAAAAYRWGAVRFQAVEDGKQVGYEVQAWLGPFALQRFRVVRDGVPVVEA